MKGTGCPRVGSPSSSPPAGVCHSPFTPPSRLPSLFPGVPPSLRVRGGGNTITWPPALRIYPGPSRWGPAKLAPPLLVPPSQLRGASPALLCTGPHRCGSSPVRPTCRVSTFGYGRRRRAWPAARGPGDCRAPPPACPGMFTEGCRSCPERPRRRNLGVRRQERGPQRAAAGRLSLKRKKETGLPVSSNED